MSDYNTGSSGQLLTQKLCRRCGWWLWGNWCLCWDHSLVSRCNVGNCRWTIYLWSWLFTGILRIGRDPWQILIRVSGFPIIFVKTWAGHLQNRALLFSMFWLSSGMLSLTLSCLPSMCWLECCLMCLGMTTILRWYPPIFAPGRGVWLFVTGSQSHSWCHSSVYGTLVRPCISCGRGRFNVWSHGSSF